MVSELPVVTDLSLSVLGSNSVLPRLRQGARLLVSFPFPMATAFPP